jgi:hypothetical protein
MIHIKRFIDKVSYIENKQGLSQYAMQNRFEKTFIFFIIEASNP